MRYDIFETVWGAPYVKKFLDYSLASQLSPGNLPALAGFAEIHYHIYTDRASEPYFHPAIDAIADHAKLHFHFYEDITYGAGTLAEAMENSDPAIVKHNNQRLTSQHLLAHAASEPDSAVLLLDSDFIFSDGSFRYIHAQRRRGAKAVCAFYLRLCEDDAGPILAGEISGGISARRLVNIGLNALHPIAASMFAEAEDFTSYPAQISWRVGEGGGAGFVSHCFYPHPVMVTPITGATYWSSMDYECAFRLVPDNDQIHLCRSSDDLLVCKMSPRSYLADAEKSGRASIDNLAQFALNNTNIRHRHFMDQPIRFIADDGDFDAVERTSEKFIEAMYKAVELTLGHVKNASPKQLLRLKSFLGPIEDYLSPQIYARMKNWIE